MENCGSAVGCVIRLLTWPSDQPRHATRHLNLPDRNQIAPVKRPILTLGSGEYLILSTRNSKIQEGPFGKLETCPSELYSARSRMRDLPNSWILL